MTGLQPLDTEKMQLLQELEVEMMSDMYHRMTNACHRKCIPPKYKEAELGKGEAVCLDRCIAKYLDIYDRVGKKLTELSMPDDDIMKKMQTEQQTPNTMSDLYNFIRENHVLLMIESAAEKRVSDLNLSNWEISQIPVPLLLCSHLTKLYLNNNYLKTLPEEIGNWENLTLLTLDYNHLTDIPSSIGKLKNLVCLNLSYNNLGSLPPEIGLLSKLEILWLNHTYLEFLPPEIGNCTELDTLGARGNFIKELPPEIGKLHKLRWMTLECNLLCNLPPELNGLHQLIHLNLNNNRFVAVPRLEELQCLQYVFLSKNFITELSMKEIEKVNFIKKIDLQDNPISNINACRHLNNLIFDDTPNTSDDQEQDSDSEEWEESAPSSELDLSDTSEEEINLEIFITALPKVAKFTVTGF